MLASTQGSGTFIGFYRGCMGLYKVYRGDIGGIKSHSKAYRGPYSLPLFLRIPDVMPSIFYVYTKSGTQRKGTGYGGLGRIWCLGFEV